MKTAKIFTNDFNRIIAATKGFVGTSRNARKMNQYIRLEFSAEFQTVTAIAVDGYRMSVEHSVCCECGEDFVAYVRNSIKLPNKMYSEISVDNGECIIRCGDFLFGYQQPDGEFLDWKNALPDGCPSMRIGFNGNYLLSALQAAKISAGNSFKSPVVLEFRGPLYPVVIRTNKEDIKMVLPVRIKEN